MSQERETSQDSVQSERWETPLSRALETKEKSGRARGVGVGAAWERVFPQAPEAPRRRKRSRESDSDLVTREEMEEAIRRATRETIATLMGQGRPPLHPHSQPSSFHAGWSSCASATDVALDEPHPVDTISVSFITLTNRSYKFYTTLYGL